MKEYSTWRILKNALSDPRCILLLYGLAVTVSVIGFLSFQPTLLVSNPSTEEILDQPASAWSWRRGKTNASTATRAPYGSIAGFTNETTLDGKGSLNVSQSHLQAQLSNATAAGENSMRLSSAKVNDTHFSDQLVDARSAQIQNYKRNASLIINVHITHHAGTSACRMFGMFGPVPSFACLVGDDWPPDVPNYARPPPLLRPESIAWTRNETNRFATRVRELYHMVAWEFSAVLGVRGPPISETDWESPHIVSIIIMRHPIDRLLAGDGFVGKAYGNENTRTIRNWWRFANSVHTDNFALSVLAGNKCCDGENTSEIHLQKAKELISRFTYVLDMACLDKGLIAVATELGLADSTNQRLKNMVTRGKKKRRDTSERIGNATLYQFLLRRNRLDIELYEWSRERSLVNCSAIAK